MFNGNALQALAITPAAASPLRNAAPRNKCPQALAIPARLAAQAHFPSQMPQIVLDRDLFATEDHRDNQCGQSKQNDRATPDTNGAIGGDEYRQSDPAKEQEGEYGRFTRLLDRLLSVPHEKIKAELDAEKRNRTTKRKRAASGHAFRDKD